MNTILAGRFAPFLNSQVVMARQATTIVITAAEAARSARLPWTAAEREAMIRAALGDAAAAITFIHADDDPYGDAPYPVDDSRDAQEAVCAAFFAGADDKVAAAVPPAVMAWMVDFRSAADYGRLADEARYVAGYKASWAASPFPPMFITVDTVITCAGHVLLIQRGGQPGRGLWATPGGFLDVHEPVQASAIRELREETGLSLSDDEARAALKASRVFDDPRRSAIGRVVTHGFHFELSGSFPPVAAGDDAREARWWPIADLPSLRGRFHDDHAHILDWFLGRPR